MGVVRRVAYRRQIYFLSTASKTFRNKAKGDNMVQFRSSGVALRLLGEGGLDQRFLTRQPGALLPQGILLLLPGRNVDVEQ